MGEVKRESDCTTLDHWRIRAIHLEAEWARCSQHCAVIQTERDTLRAKLAASEAACAAKDAALRATVTLIRDRVPSGPDLHNACAALEAALSTDAGKGWIDASGAVEGSATVFVPSHGVEVCASVPAEWDGDDVLIVRVAK